MIPMGKGAEPEDFEFVAMGGNRRLGTHAGQNYGGKM